MTKVIGIWVAYSIFSACITTAIWLAKGASVGLVVAATCALCACLTLIEDKKESK